MDYFDFLLSVVQHNSGLTALLSLILAALIAIIGFLFEWRRERRARDTFSIERRRLTEVNIKIGHRVRVVPVHDAATSTDGARESAFTLLRLPMRNIGDGPVDVLAMLAAGRVLSAVYKKGIGTRSRDVEWDDYQPFYWNDARAGQVYSGISTTKHMVARADAYTRLAAQESALMRRVDAVNSVAALRERGSVTIMYRVFMVARGYPLGEILRQLGGGPPDPAENVTQELLQFQTLAQPDFRRWYAVQAAMINLNRFVVRLATYDPDHADDSADPLGLIARPDAWRMFLLHHWEFLDDDPHAAPETLPKAYRVDVPPGALNAIANVTEAVRRWYKDLILPDNWTADEEARRTFAEAQAYCKAHLGHIVKARERLVRAIKLCEDFPTDKPAPKGCPRESYPRLIHGDPEYRERWLALMREGYLVSKPFPRGRLSFAGPLGIVLFGRRRGYGRGDIPADPRVLEPYVMRTHYFLETAGLDVDEA